MQLLLSGPIPLMLWRLAAPNVSAVVIMSVVTFTDALFVGYLGTAQLASLALIFPFQTLMQMMAGGAIGGGITSSVARAIGGGSSEKAESAAWHALIIGGLMAFLYTATLGLFSRPVFALLGGTGETLEGAVLYAKISFGGAFVTWAVFILSAILRGAGDTATPARAMIGGSVLQIVLSGALTLGWGPIPEMAIAGPAIAMIVCHGCMAAYLALYLARDKAGTRPRPQCLRLAPLADIMKVGGMGLLNSITISFTVVAVTGIVGRYGIEALAGYGLGSRLELMLVPIAFGIGAALTAAVGVNVGAGQFARARRIAWTGAGVTFLVTGLIAITATIFPHLWLDRFTADPAAYAFGGLYLSIVAPFYCVFASGQTLYFASQGTGRMILPVSVGVVRFILVAGVGGSALVFSWPFEIVFAGVCAGLMTIGVGLSLCLFGPGWRPR